jgi:hypothetical protein
MKQRILQTCSALLAGTLLAGCSTVQIMHERVLVADGSDTLFVQEASLPTMQAPEKAQTWKERLTGLPAGMTRMIVGAPEIPRLARPTDIHIDADGVGYICDGDLGRVLVAQPDGSVGVLEPAELATPTGVERIPAGLVISDSGRGDVFLINRLGLVSGRLQAASPWMRPGQMLWNGEKLFVCDTGRHVIEIFDGEGQHLSTLGESGSGPGQFIHPVAVAEASDGTLWVLDALNHRVQSFDAGLKPLASFGVYDRAPGGLMFPKGLALDEEDHIYISDAAFNRIQVFSSSGALLYWFGDTGRGEHDFLLPGALHAAGNRIYVANQYNRRVDVFHYQPQEALSEVTKP